MPSIVSKLIKENIITPPKFLEDNVMYETIMGSVSYGVSDDNSDMDIYGFCIPPKNIVFPHLNGQIEGFGKQKNKFECYQEHHIKFEDKEYDLNIYNIVRYIDLTMQGNPNMVDSIFTPINCVKHQTSVGMMVRSNRHLFLHKGLVHRLKGYAFQQLKKAKSSVPVGKRKEKFDADGQDNKYLYHLVRLCSQAEQILVEHDLDLQEKGRREHMKSIRRNEIPFEDIQKWFNEKERQLEKLYHESTLPWGPDEEKIKQLLMNCLEEHYGNLDNCITQPDAAMQALREIQETVDKHRKLING